MSAPSPRVVARRLAVLVKHQHVIAPWNDAALTLLADRGHATAAHVYQANGRLARSKLWSITHTGRAWWEGA